LLRVICAIELPLLLGSSIQVPDRLVFYAGLSATPHLLSGISPRTVQYILVRGEDRSPRLLARVLMPQLSSFVLGKAQWWMSKRVRRPPPSEHLLAPRMEAESIASLL